jgi:hypothetical protein
MSSKKPKFNPMEKTALSQNRCENLGRNQLAFQKYMDKMDNALNQNILDNIKPYWRDHPSTKGK